MRAPGCTAIAASVRRTRREPVVPSCRRTTAAISAPTVIPVAAKRHGRDGCRTTRREPVVSLFRRQRQRHKSDERGTRRKAPSAATTKMTTSINRRRERCASNERCAGTPEKGVTVTRQSRRESHRRRHDDDDVTMIATIAIGTAMAAELDASNATINKKATAWRWASAEKRREDDNCRAQRASTRRKSRSQ